MQKISDTVAETFIREGIIEPEEKEIYAYGWRALGMWSLCTATMFLIGTALGEFRFTVVYFIAFSVLRAYYDGYHAKSREICFISSMTLFIMCVICVKYYMETPNHFFLIFIIFCIYLGMNLLKFIEYNSMREEDRAEKYQIRKLIMGICAMTCIAVLFLVALRMQLTVVYAGIFIAFIMTFLLFSLKRIMLYLNK